MGWESVGGGLVLFFCALLTLKSPIEMFKPDSIYPDQHVGPLHHYKFAG